MMGWSWASVRGSTPIAQIGTRPAVTRATVSKKSSVSASDNAWPSPGDAVPLLGRRNRVERTDLVVPHGDVVAVSDDHQRRSVQNATRVREHVVVHEQLDRREGVAVLVARGDGGLQVEEDLGHFGEGPRDELGRRVGARHREVAMLARLVTGAPVGEDRITQATEADGAVHSLHVRPTV